MNMSRKYVGVMFTMLASLSVAGCGITTPSNYAGQQDRKIKALLIKEQTDWLQGKGVGLASASVFNGYPGPMHTLEFASAPELTSQQREQTQILLKEHKARVGRLGAALIVQEKQIDDFFSTKKINLELLKQASHKISMLQGEIRADHLNTHFQQTAILNPIQVAQYQRLRGFGN